MRIIHKGAAVAIVGSAMGLFAAAGPAFAGSITSPSDGFNVPESTGGAIPAGTPLPFQVTGSGWGANTSVLIEICDGNNPSTLQGWDPTINCDLATSPASESSPAGTPTFPATGTGRTIGDFRGIGPSDLFNCLAAEDVTGLTQNADGSWPVTASSTANGEQIDPSQTSWTNCQLRMSTNDTAVTTDQAFIHLVIPDTPAQTPEAPFAILLPVGAVGLLGGAVLFARRRRSVRAA